MEDLKSADIGFKGMVPTLNRTGVMVEHLIPYSSDFAEYAGNYGGEVLDIGCAYGVAIARWNAVQQFLQWTLSKSIWIYLSSVSKIIIGIVSP
ncbi:hypothetical protein [Bacillus velezensis]|uniref:hypothetical protein n=1 Tax=Bacillus velezensis TaxID=492670 RepID=UPI0015F52D7D|nr:hypothetical protein [Bacillus velezensis]